MPENQHYVSPLLSAFAVDYSKNAREGLISTKLFPRVQVTKKTGFYAVFSKEDALKIQDATMAGNRASANELHEGGEMKPYATIPFALKKFIDKEVKDEMEGPFKRWQKKLTERIVTKLELLQEKRVADIVASIPNRTKTLTGTGTGVDHKWSITGENTGGDPYTAIKNAMSQLFIRPNIMTLNESVFNTLEDHPVLLEKLGEANMIKKVNEETLAKLFRIDKVFIAEGKGDSNKKNKDKTVDPVSLWGNSVVLGYTSEEEDTPCCGKTFSVKDMDADDNCYIVRTWPVEDGGMKGGEYIQVGHHVVELVVCPELIYVLKDVL